MNYGFRKCIYRPGEGCVLGDDDFRTMTLIKMVTVMVIMTMMMMMMMLMMIMLKLMRQVSAELRGFLVGHNILRCY